MIIRATVVGGIATATEVSVVGIIYTIVVGIAIYRELDRRTLYPALLRDGVAQRRDPVHHRERDGDELGAHPVGLRGAARGHARARARRQNRRAVISIVMFVVLGSVLEGIPAIVLFGPLLFPIATAAGIDEVHYAICVVLAMGVGLFSPPLGVGFFGACAIGKAEPERTCCRCCPTSARSSSRWR